MVPLMVTIGESEMQFEDSTLKGVATKLIPRADIRQINVRAIIVLTQQHQLARPCFLVVVVFCEFDESARPTWASQEAFPSAAAHTMGPHKFDFTLFAQFSSTATSFPPAPGKCT